MEILNENPEPKKGINKTFIAAFLVGAVLVGGVVFGLFKFRGATVEEQKSRVFEDALTEGSADFEALTRRIVIQTNEATQATTPLGAVLMTARGTIRNNSDKVITALEVKVSILDEKRNPVKEKSVIVVPGEKFLKLEPRQEVELSVSIDGFKEGDDRADIRWKVTAIKVE